MSSEQSSSISIESVKEKLDLNDEMLVLELFVAKLKVFVAKCQIFN